MNYKLIIYILVVLVTTFALSGVNFDRFFKTKHIIEANIFVLLLILAISELVSTFIIDFMTISKII